MAAKEAQSISYEVPPTGAVPRIVHTVPHNQHDLPIQNDPYGQALTHSPRNGPLTLRGYLHMFDSYTVWKLGKPHFYRKPGYGYEKLASHRHVDVMDREWTGDYDDRYISAWDGKISKLVVQAVDDVYDSTPNSTWRRTFVRNVAPYYLRLANWPFSHVDYSRGGGPTSEDWPMILIKWFCASLAISFVVGTPRKSPPYRNNGMYDSFPYKYIGCPKVARNALEADSTPQSRRIEVNPVAERILRPRYLCLLQEKGRPALVTNVEAWIKQHKSEGSLSYIFVAYTAEQFQTIDDLKDLHQIADAAARNAGVSAYWVGCSCMPEPAQLQDDVYRICDVIRGAHSLAIAVNRSKTGTRSVSTTDEMLQQWGRRVWTFPEVLLSPAGKDIKIYVRGNDLMSPIIVAKNQFAATVWNDDAKIARQLVDHYEGNLILSHLELVTLALECLHKRETTQYLPGDHSYALMGLLRIRPRIDPTDSAFQAFARLSLANNNDQLLERLICIEPKTPNQPWHAMDDAYGAKLWDILPQWRSIAAISKDDTIILDGCHAATVRWKSFTPVAHDRIFSFKRFFALGMIHTSGYLLLISIILLSVSAPNEFYPGDPIAQLAGGLLLAWSISMTFLNPWLLHLMYLGKFWKTQGWFFAFEGYMSVEDIERQLFGARLGRMKWTPYGSPLSRHHKNAHDECVPDDPTSDPEVRKMVEQSRHAKPGQQRIFTLVDTGSMTVTLFQAARPPVCFLLAGSEGGMQRAIGCSYDWTTATLYRETVLRMETPIIDKMHRVSRVKIGFNRPLHPYNNYEVVGEARGQMIH